MKKAVSFYLSDNTVWMFQEYMLSESELEGYIQTVAFDISEIYYNSEKIRRIMKSWKC